MFFRSFPALLFLFSALFSSGCISPKEKFEQAKLLKTVNAGQEELLDKINNLAKINSLRAKMDLKFEDNSYAEVGIAEKYKSADGEVVVQRPANIWLKVQVPVIKTDVAQMSSNGTKFCVAILQDGGSGRYKKFICGTNNADYSVLQEQVQNTDLENGKVIKQNLNAFANLRPQHFTEAMLVRPVDKENYAYLTSTIFQEELEVDTQKRKVNKWFLRGYYLLDELKKQTDGNLKIARRFWFDRVGSIRLARQQIFDDEGEVESDIIYGQEGSLGSSGEYNNLPLQISVTRPKEKYKMRLTYQTPENVSIGKKYSQEVFELKNVWGLPEVNLDEKMREFQSPKSSGTIPKNATRLQ
jgi:hypothetical protein